jgi:outer membrane protein OmpA-like peptidoglycan-associated protein
VLKMVAEALKADAGMRLRIEGHTDSSGDAAKNMDLSARRAESVKRELAAKYGIDAGRLETAGLGASKPAADNATPTGRAENRRVEFVKL